MTVANMTIEKTTDFSKTVGKYLVAVAMATWAFGESAGRARAAAELSRQGFHKEARALMLGDKDV